MDPIISDLTDQEKAFVKNLKELLDSHGLILDENEVYDGDEKFCGRTYDFTGQGMCLPIRTVSRFLEQL